MSLLGRDGRPLVFVELEINFFDILDSAAGVLGMVLTRQVPISVEVGPPVLGLHLFEAELAHLLTLVFLLHRAPRPLPHHELVLTVLATQLLVDCLSNGFAGLLALI